MPFRIIFLSILLHSGFVAFAEDPVCTPTDANYLKIHFLAEGYPVRDISNLIDKHCEDLEIKLRNTQFIKDLSDVCIEKSRKIVSTYCQTLTEILAKDEPQKTEEYVAFDKDLRLFDGSLSEAVGEGVLVPLIQSLKNWSDTRGFSDASNSLGIYLDNLFTSAAGTKGSPEDLAKLVVWLDSLKIALHAGVLNLRDQANIFYQQERSGASKTAKYEAFVYDETHKKLYKWIQCIERVLKDIEEGDFETANFLKDGLEHVVTRF